MDTVKIKKILGRRKIFCPVCEKWVSLSLFKKQDKILVCVFCGFVIDQDEQKWQFV
jgi:Zn ribbon nucleic-acid-binding protein